MTNLLLDINLQFLLSGFLIFLVIFALESVLSIDNAAVLALIVNKLPEHQRGKALTYGIVGAYVFRGLSIFGVSWLLANPDIGNYLKIAGGLYLFKLVWGHFTPKKDTTEEGDVNWIENLLKLVGLSIPLFWIIVIEVEWLDFVFSVDNILPGEAWPNILWFFIPAVFAAILSMRFVTKKMSVLMEKHPYLENRAYIVIGLIAAKLVLSAIAGIFGLHTLNTIFENHYSDLIFSLLTMAFFLPIGVKKNEYVNPNTTTNNNIS